MSTHDTILVTINGGGEGYWYPRAFTPRELATYLQGRSEHDPGEEFRLWDIDSDGQPQECELEETSSEYDENDWATIAVRVVRIDTGEFIVGTGYRVDGRA